jgi:hypothetical protein
MKFQTRLESNGKTATGIEVPSEVVESFGAGRKPAVRVTLKDYTYRSTVATMGGRFMVGVSAEVREKAGVAAGDWLEVTVELDTAPREVEMPADFATALRGDVKARQFFESLNYSNKRRLVLNIEGTNNPETRARRVAKALENLRAGKA